jgi:hypothetical protein
MCVLLLLLLFLLLPTTTTSSSSSSSSFSSRSQTLLRPIQHLFLLLLPLLLQDKVEARNKDYAKVVAHLHFHTLPKGQAQQQQQQQQQVAASAARSHTDHSGSPMQLPARGSSEGGVGWCAVCPITTHTPCRLHTLNPRVRAPAALLVYDAT